MTTTIAKITNRRPSTNTNGSHICEVTCRACSKTITVSYGGWTALACTCGATIERNSATDDRIECRQCATMSVPLPGQPSRAYYCSTACYENDHAHVTELAIKYTAKGDSERFETDRCVFVIKPNPKNAGTYSVHKQDEKGGHWMCRKLGGDPIRTKAEARDRAIRGLVDIASLIPLCDYCNDKGTKSAPCDACGEGRY